MRRLCQPGQGETLTIGEAFTVWGGDVGNIELFPAGETDQGVRMIGQSVFDHTLIVGRVHELLRVREGRKRVGLEGHDPGPGVAIAEHRIHSVHVSRVPRGSDTYAAAWAPEVMKRLDDLRP